MIKALQTILKALEIIVRVVSWVIVNGVPFIRGIIEEFKALREKRAAKK